MDNKELQEFKDKLIVGMQHVFKLAAEGIAAYEKPAVTHYTGLPKPTHYSVSEGDPWQEWKTVIIERGFTANVQRVHAIKFEGGAIFDMINGWRTGAEEDRKVVETKGRTGKNFREIGRTPHGYTIFVEDNEVGGQTYWSDEISGGVVVWDNCIVARESIEFVLAYKEPERLVPRYQTAQCDCGRFEGDCRRGEECGRNPVPRYENMGQQRGQDTPSIPDCAYYENSNETFVSHLTGDSMGTQFRDKWFHRRNEFPRTRQNPLEKFKRTSTDQRVMPRALLEHLRVVLLTIREAYPNAANYMGHSLVEVEKALATEKSELSDPPIDVSRGAMRPCRNYEPNGFYGSICAKCGWPCAEHSK